MRLPKSLLVLTILTAACSSVDGSPIGDRSASTSASDGGHPSTPAPSASSGDTPSPGTGTGNDPVDAAAPEEDAAPSEDAAVHDAETDAAHDAGTAADGGKDGGGGGAKGFGSPCQTNADCKDAAYNLCANVMMQMICTKACTTNADCPHPPTQGTCTPKMFCK